MKPSANSKLPYTAPAVKVAEFQVERGFVGSDVPEPDSFSLEYLLGSQESPVQYTEATEATGWNSNFE